MKTLKLIILAALSVSIVGCGKVSETQSEKTAKAVERQQSQYNIVQPIPAYDWSLERDLVIQLYNIRNMKAATHSVWRSDRGLVEGDCASIGFGIPYDTSLTNPLVATDIDMQGEEHAYQGGALASVEQPEPNGIFASKNTSATWVMCAGDMGSIEPVYVETKVTVYPYPVKVDYSKNTAVKSGKATVTLTQ
jgi:hypothetical protein